MWQRRGIAILGFLGALLLIRFAFTYLAPFFIALVLALILDPPVTYLEKLGLARPISSFIFVFIAFFGLPLFLSLFLVHLWHEIKALAGIATLSQLPYLFSEKITEFIESFPAFRTHFSSLKLMDFAEPLFRWAIAIPDFLLVWLLAALCAYFFCKDKRKIAQYIVRLLPARWRVHFFELYHETYGAIWRLILIQLTLILLSTALTMAIFCLLRLPYALILSLVAGFLDLIPVLGPGIIYCGLIVFYLWLKNIPLAIAIGVSYLFFLLLRQWGEPQLVGDRLGLHPAAALLAVYFGFKFWGILGAFLAPLVLVFFKAALALETL